MLMHYGNYNNDVNGTPNRQGNFIYNALFKHEADSNR